MTHQKIAEEAKRQSRGWSDSMDGVSIVRRLAKLEELYDCWKSLKRGKKIPPQATGDSSPIHGSRHNP